jgi:hypothetical protein
LQDRADLLDAVEQQVSSAIRNRLTCRV